MKELGLAILDLPITSLKGSPRVWSVVRVEDWIGIGMTSINVESF